MGHEVRITRKRDWVDETGPIITLEEWDKLVAGDADLLSVNFAGCFDADSSGNIVAKNPGRPVRAKMYQVAQRLGAKVQGDEGELYGADGEPVNPAARNWIAGRERLLLLLVLIAAVIVLCQVR